jgi:hypothetical protein
MKKPRPGSQPIVRLYEIISLHPLIAPPLGTKGENWPIENHLPAPVNSVQPCCRTVRKCNSPLSSNTAKTPGCSILNSPSRSGNETGSRMKAPGRFKQSRIYRKAPRPPPLSPISRTISPTRTLIFSRAVQTSIRLIIFLPSARHVDVSVFLRLFVFGEKALCWHQQSVNVLGMPKNIQAMKTVKTSISSAYHSVFRQRFLSQHPHLSK